MAEPRYEIKIGTGQGVGGFLSPPGWPNHTHGITEYAGPRSKKVIGIYSLDTDAEWIPESVRARAAEILAAAKAAITPSERWIRYVYGYFHNAWSPDGVDRHAGHLTMGPRPDGTPLDWHAAVMHISEYFPDHKPREDLIADPGNGYGSHECAKCGARVQYEPQFDRFTAVSTDIMPSGVTRWQYGTECPKGGEHS